VVKGVLGSGKSTLTRKLALRWAQGSCDSDCHPQHCIHKFVVLILLQAEDLKGANSIPEAILQHLVEETFDLTESDLEDLLLDMKTLFIIDDYALDIPLLDELITHQSFEESTVVVTSHPIPNFPFGYSIQSFNDRQQRDFIRQNVNLRASKELMSLIEVEDLCSTPLNLCIYSLLYMDGRLEDITTRTQLCQKIIEFLIEKSSSQVGKQEEIRKTLATFI
jgi:adenylate kinase family enzyme